MQTRLAGIGVDSLKGVGPKVAQKLEQLGIKNLEDLLFHLPYKYQDRSRVCPIGELRQGESALVFGQIEAADITFGKRRSLVCRISDGSGLMDIRLFYFSMAQKKQFIRGQYIQCYGQATLVGRRYSMIHPELTYLREQDSPVLEQGLKAIYPSTDGLQQRIISSLMEQALTQLKRARVRELLPEKWLTSLKFPPLVDALTTLHKPPLDLSLSALQSGNHPLIQRLAFEELVAQHIAMLKIKHRGQQRLAASIPEKSNYAAKLISDLPFTLTTAQQRVIGEIEKDMARKYPMMRLVQGDVGSGKTLVAACVMLNVVSNTHQAALMAPTEILAEQHFKAFANWCKPLGIKAVLLISKMSAGEKRDALAAIESGQAEIVIGTHALFQNQVIFKDLALVVIDEQHRFGVEQRKALLEKGWGDNQKQLHPHQLVMTATPIPRTLAQTAYADLDLSVIDELPPGRKPIQTVVMSDSKRDAVIERVRQACLNDKRQVYWVCTLIEDSEELQCQAAEATYEQLQTVLSSLRVGLIHGRMKPAEKQRVMQAFKDAEIDLLVATTVIEVGVDVPNASLMIIENPERLGLSQLHQLRGRVGRGDKESHCLLMYHGQLSKNAQQRLEVMRSSNDGFVIAEKDLELRGPGEVLGTRQTGALEYRFADLVRDSHLLTDVYLCADEILSAQDVVAEALCNRWVRHADSLSQV
ncbi:ATP-dependent DNA helicase RecG [Aliikangiella sp. G2MR2-5]|uniref:ATP-dependent DNA helicase RecG n=1 Tax=Aliikangiella sp. G2MR2-5 TaxID=2788943 RepID=UPI0018A88FEF|nr:ATP-dependent DNA helicase RecG [Aliikangiella sp. G2MR2-5]